MALAICRILRGTVRPPAGNRLAGLGRMLELVHESAKSIIYLPSTLGRGQAAMELYRRQGGAADSAGTRVTAPGQTLADVPPAATILRVMHDVYGIDMSSNTRTQLTPRIALGYDKLVVMAEPETIPGWLVQDSRTELWPIADPKGKDVRETMKIVHKIEQRIADKGDFH